MKSKVNRVVKCVAFLGLVLSAQLVAANGAAVSHSHNGRTHSHPLPSEGLSHSHSHSHSAQRQKQVPSADWIFIGQTDETFPTKYYAKVSSLRKTSDTVAILGQIRYSLTKTTALAFWSVSRRDCSTEYGKLNIRFLDSGQAGSVPFALGGTSIGSSIAEQLCAVF